MDQLHCGRIKFERLHTEKCLIDLIFLLILNYQIMDFGEENPVVNVYLVTELRDMPCKQSPGKILYACSRSFEHPSKWDYIWVRDDAPPTDRFGMTYFEHEKLHVLCNCNFHFNDKMEELLKEVEDPYNLVITYMKEIKILEQYYLSS